MKAQMEDLPPAMDSNKNGSDDKMRELPMAIGASHEARTMPPMLRLPFEVLHLILKYTTVATFFNSQLTCKHLFRAARSKPLLKHHHSNLPDLHFDVAKLGSKRSLQQFRKRAVMFSCDVNVRADLAEYRAEKADLIARSVFALATGDAVASPLRFILAVPQRNGTIQLYSLTSRILDRREELQIRCEDENPNPIQICKIAFATGTQDLAVLYLQEESSYYAPVPGLPKDAPAMSNYITYKLVVFQRLHTPLKGHFYSSFQQETRDIPFNAGSRPIGLALHADGTACISLQTSPGDNRTAVFQIYRSTDRMHNTSYDPAPKIEPIGNFAYPRWSPEDKRENGNMGNLCYHNGGQTLYLSVTGWPLPMWISHVDSRSGRFGLHQSTLTDLEYVGLDQDFDISEAGLPDLVCIDIPFFRRHFCRQRGKNTNKVQLNPNDTFAGARGCKRSSLTFGIHNRSHGTGDVQMYILSNEMTLPCNHDSTSEQQGQKWRISCELDGYQQGASSLGTIMAVSPLGSGIATAVWSHVQIWRLGPKALCQAGPARYFPAQDYDDKTRIGQLRPVTLPTFGAIVHQLCWVNEDELYAATDSGLVRWNIGPRASGKRERLTLAYDIRPLHAPIAPVNRVACRTLPATLTR